MKEQKNEQQKNFWADFDQPFFVLAPMYDVTDTAFRQIITKYSAPDVVVAEFVSADGLVHPVGREKLMHHLWFDESERRGGQTKIVAQIFGATPENFYTAAGLIADRGFDGIDINMGCPVKNIQKQSTGADLINHPELAGELIQAAQEGAKGLPVSVKTRIGYNDLAIDTWIPALLTYNPAALTVHLRTKKEMSDVPAHWDLMPEIVALKNAIAPHVSLIGNGDIIDLADGTKKIEDTACDGAMLGRAVFGNPWLFNKDQKEISPEQKVRVMVEHTALFEELFTDVKNFAIMKKHYKAYCNGFADASVLRAQLMSAEDVAQVRAHVNTFLARTV